MENYEPLVGITGTIYVSDGDWQETAFQRRMTVMRTSSGELFVHNPFELSAEDLAKLRQLGRIRAVIAPNAIHASDLGWMAEAVPEAEVFVPARLEKKQRKRFGARVKTLEKDWPSDLEKEIECFPVQGLRFLHESVFLHKPSKTLVVTDLVFNMDDVFKGFEKKFMDWNRVGHGIGAFSKTIERLNQLDFSRVIMGHGRVFESTSSVQAKQAFISSFSRLI